VIETERIESLKAGGLATLAVFPTWVMLTGSHYWAGRLLSDLALVGVWPRLISGAIALVAGFLFGITYRYVIRQDQNSHLKSGAVLAFGLVRGLAQIEGSLAQTVAPLSLLLMVGESCLLFAVAQWSLDGAIGQGWLQPLGGRCENGGSAGSQTINSAKSAAP
jgi:hypothetical protein